MTALNNLPDLLLNGAIQLLLCVVKIALAAWMTYAAWQLAVDNFKRLFRRSKRRNR